jgi:Zn-dependent peptidase ImmA (M78 family)
MHDEEKSPKGRALIKPELLRWARESTHLDLRAAAKAAHVSDPAKFAAAEEGGGGITFRQLEAFAHACRLPLRVFYLQRPPREAGLPVDFRSATDERNTLTPALIRVLREARERQAAAIELRTDLRIEKNRFPEIASENEITSILTEMVCAKYWDKALLRGTSETGSTRALSFTKEILEARFPVLIFEFPGDDVAHVRGCSLYDENLSLVLISSQDNPNARRFTVVHEFVHLLLRQSGMCSPLSASVPDEVERRCNAIAGEALMPDRFLRPELNDLTAAGNDAATMAATIARIYRVSHSAAAVRMRQLGATTSAELSELLDSYAQLWLRNRARQSEGDGGGPHYHLLQVQRLGPSFTEVVLSGFDKNLLSVTQAAKLLGVAPSYKSFESMREKLMSVHGQ